MLLVMISPSNGVEWLRPQEWLPQVQNSKGHRDEASRSPLPVEENVSILQGDDEDCWLGVGGVAQYLPCPRHWQPLLPHCHYQLLWVSPTRDHTRIVSPLQLPKVGLPWPKSYADLNLTEDNEITSE